MRTAQRRHGARSGRAQPEATGVSAFVCFYDQLFFLRMLKLAPQNQQCHQLISLVLEEQRMSLEDFILCMFK